MRFEYTVIRSSRKSVSVQVDSQCNIIVRAPYLVSQKQIDSFMQNKKEWLEKAILSQREKAKNIKTYTEGEIADLRKMAKVVLPQKVEYFSGIMGVTPTGVKINSAKKRYGSCSASNSLNFSLYLMAEDEEFINYVVVHELAHIKHHNHSKDFYAFVEKFVPDYKKFKK